MMTMYTSDEESIWDNTENKTIIEYPSSGRRVVKDSKGNVISDSNTNTNTHKVR
jgi:hypothetical protein